MEKELVSNASSLIFIGKLGIFNLLKNVCQRILIPKQVFDEIFKYNKPENNLIQKELDSNFIVKQDIKSIKEIPLHIGERASISLCLEKNIKTFLSDDKKARRYARSLNLDTIGILGIILENLRAKSLNKKQAKELIKELIDKGYYMSPGLYAKTLELIEGV
jgi:predicted nucleic acid-binding protein